jgi:hypothetical protein
MARSALVIALIALAGCARSEDASLLADANDTMPAIERRADPDAGAEEIAVGEWREATQDQLPALEFGAPGVAPQFSLRCDDRRGLMLQRHSNAPSGDTPTMLVTVGREARRLAVTAPGGTVPMLRASLPSGDPMIATIAGAAVPIEIRINDAPPLVLPPGPAIAIFVGRCTSTGTAPAAAETNTSAEAEPANAAAPAGNSAR